MIPPTSSPRAQQKYIRTTEHRCPVAPRTRRGLVRASVASGAKPLPDIGYIFIIPLSNGGHHNARAKFGTVETGNSQAFNDGTTSLLTTWPPSHPETSLDQWLQNTSEVVGTLEHHNFSLIPGWLRSRNQRDERQRGGCSARYRTLTAL